MVVGKYFEPIDSGSVLQTCALASALAKHGNLTVVELGYEHDVRSRYGPASGTVGDLPYRGSARFIRGPGESGMVKLSKEKRSRIRREHGIHRWLAPRDELGAWTLEQVLLSDADLVVMVQIDFAGPVLGGIDIPLVMQTHNHESSAALSHLRRSSRSRLKEHAYRYWCIRNYERIGFPRAAQIWCVSNADAQRYVDRPVPKERIFVIPNVVPPSAFRTDPPIGRSGLGLFFGHLGYGPNRDAVLTLADMSNDLTARGISNEILLLGNGADDDLRAAIARAPGLRFCGFVNDLMSTLDEASVVIIPLTFGGGTKLKVIEAMAAGRPVLTTAVGVEGIDGVVDGVHAIIRPVGPSFTEQAAEMLADPPRFAHIGLAGQELVRRRYGMASLDAAVDSALRLLPS